MVESPPDPGQMCDQKRRHQDGQEQPHTGVSQKQHLVERWQSRFIQRERLESDPVRQSHQEQVEGVGQHESRQPDRDGEQLLQRRRQQGRQLPTTACAGAGVQSRLRHPV